MRRLYILFAALAVVLALVSCEGAEKLSVDDVVACFDSETYYVNSYDETQITEINGKLALEGELLQVVHVIKNDTAPPTLVWTYIYEFSLEKDAVAFAENRAVFVKSIDNGRCVRLGNIVVYGNSEVVAELEK